MTQLTSNQLQSLLFAGGSIVVDADSITASVLQSLAYTAKTHKCVIIIKNAQKLTSAQCNSIAFASGGEGNIIFDFT